MLSGLQESHCERLEVLLVGADPKASRISSARIVPWTLQSEVEILRQFDIGIMPLPADDKWAASKAGYKLLQYMATAIPCVASPVGANQELVQHGVNGYLAGSDAEWESALARLIESKQLRLQMGRAGRKLAEESYSHQVAALKLVEGLRSL